jgi:hypothetical protein
MIFLILIEEFKQINNQNSCDDKDCDTDENSYDNINSVQYNQPQISFLNGPYDLSNTKIPSTISYLF